MVVTNTAKAITRRPLLVESPYEALGNNTFRAVDLGNVQHEDFADIFATGMPREYWGEGASKKPIKQVRRYPFLDPGWIGDRVTLKRARHKRQWQSKNTSGATVLMDNLEALRRSGAAGRPIKKYDFVEKLSESIGKIKHGTRSLRQLNADELRGDTTIVGYNVSPTEFPENDTAEGISLYPNGWEVGPAIIKSNLQLKGILGSARTYLSDRSTLYRNGDGVYLQTFERFAPDNWDLEGGDSLLVKAVNTVRHERGKTVNIKFEGKGLMREFYFDDASGEFIEITGNQTIPQHLKDFVNDARWRAYKRQKGGLMRQQIR